MGFDVLIPARLASTRLPGKPLLEIGGLPMVVRVAQRAALSAARSVVVATGDDRIADACQAHGVAVVTTLAVHASGSDRLAEACALLGLDGEQIVVNVQGDEPFIDPRSIDACAGLLQRCGDCVMSTVAHRIVESAEFENPNVVKVVLDARGRALYFSRAPIPWKCERSEPAPVPETDAPPDAAPLRHLGLYAYRAAFLRSFPLLAASPLEAIESLEQLRVLWHGHRIAVHVTDEAPGPGIDTPDDLARARVLFDAGGGAGFA